jgi:hypothetical protein
MPNQGENVSYPNSVTLNPSSSVPLQKTSQEARSVPQGTYNQNDSSIILVDGTLKLRFQKVEDLKRKRKSSPGTRHYKDYCKNCNNVICQDVFHSSNLANFQKITCRK